MPLLSTGPRRPADRSSPSSDAAPIHDTILGGAGNLDLGSVQEAEGDTDMGRADAHLKEDESGDSGATVDRDGDGRTPYDRLMTEDDSA